MEAWEQLADARQKSRVLANDFRQIQQSCAAEAHDKQHVLQCEKCLTAVCERLASQYLAPQPDEWFSQSDVQELIRTTLENTKAGVFDPHELQTFLLEQKAAWYLAQVKLNLVKYLDDNDAKSDLYIELNRDSPAVEEIAKAVTKALGSRAQLDFNVVADRLASSQDRPEQNQVLRDFFSKDLPDEATEGTQKIMAKLEDGVTLAEIVVGAQREKSAKEREKVEVERRQVRLDELRRARAVHEALKSKKEWERERNAKSLVPEELYNLPPCSTCSKPVETGDYISCSLCQVLTARGAQEKPTVYNSTECYEKDYERHVEDSHACASGDFCIRLRSEDVDMDADVPCVLCSECVGSLHIPTVYCSTKCADDNFQSHRESTHLPERASKGIEVDDATELLYQDGDTSNYRAKEIGKHLIPFDQALKEFEQTNAITVSHVL